MNTASEYSNLLNKLENEQKKLYLLRNNLSPFRVLKKRQLDKLIQKYDDAIYHNLLNLENVVNDEYEFLCKYKNL